MTKVCKQFDDQTIQTEIHPWLFEAGCLCTINMHEFEISNSTGRHHAIPQQKPGALKGLNVALESFPVCHCFLSLQRYLGTPTVTIHVAMASREAPVPV